MRALVTGGSSGLGAAMVQQLLQAEADVICLDRSAPDPQPNLIHVACDLADRDAVDRVIPALLAAGPYDFAVFNAGISATGKFEDIPAAHYRRLMTVNAETPMVLATALIRAGAVRRIALVSSLSHFTGYPGAAAYAASKDALAVWAKSVRKPFAARGVSVTLACPGPLRTAHAAAHAPEGAREDNRMDPAVAAADILKAALSGKPVSIPGIGPKLYALAGRVAPRFGTNQMKRIIYERLKGNVW